MSPEASTIGGDQSLEELRRELAEAREQQAATAGILAAMSSSPTDPYRAFADIAASAARLCDAQISAVLQLADGTLRLLARYGTLPTVRLIGESGFPFNRGVVAARAIIDKTTIHVADVLVETKEFPESIELAQRVGHRTVLAVPLMRAGEAIGAIAIRRAQVRPFTDRQIDLLKTFADQAVIAIENTRLFEAEQASKRELKEALNNQTAISEVLSIISRTQTDMRPVFDAILVSAVQLCGADAGGICKVEGENLVCTHWRPEAPEVAAAFRESYPRPIDTTSLVGRAVVEGTVIHVSDVEAPDAPKHLAAVSKAVGFRSQLSVPILRNGEPIGVIGLVRKAPGPFTPAQINLATTFADQAVIAIENTRLFEEVQAKTGELTEALEQQTATSEVLKVISSSSGELEPVFQTIVENAVRVCDAQFGTLFRYDGKLLHRVAGVGTPAALVEFMERRGPFLPPPTSRLHDMLQTKKVQHIVDAAADAVPSVAARFGGARSLVHVPMLKDDELVGAIVIYRQEVRPFTDKQIELVNSFATQAVIAIENVRLLNELRESLQQQTATADVLKVISRATFDLPRVLDKLVESAATRSEE